jgi:hypothetical protein
MVWDDTMYNPAALPSVSNYYMDIRGLGSFFLSFYYLMEHNITLGSGLLSSLIYPESLLGSMSSVKVDMEFVLAATEAATHDDPKERDIFFTFQSEGKKFAFNIYALRYIMYQGKSILDLIDTSKAHTLATQFKVLEVKDRVDSIDKPVYALSSYDLYDVFTRKVKASDLTKAERDEIRAGRLKQGALPLKVIDIDRPILVEVAP